jgi:hypothetical protein
MSIRAGVNQEVAMRAWKCTYLGALALALAVAFGLWNPLKEADAGRPNVPRFTVDPFWPKPLPDKWVTGEVAGTCVDSQDHVFIVNRGFQTGGLVSPETLVAKASPPVIEFDREGNVVNAWGDPSLNPDGTNAVLPNGIHGCFVDYQDNVWIGGNGDGVVQKWSHDGRTMLLQIGTKGVCDSPTGACGNVGLTGTSQTRLNQPADIAVDPANGDVYIADGYGNHRVVVFDKRGNFLRQWGGVGSAPGQFAPGDGGHPHCVVLGNDGFVYACDRGQDRIEVFSKAGVWQRDIPVVVGTGTPGLGTAGSAWDVAFSPDRNQTYLYDTDGGNEVLWIFDHAVDLILAGFGRPGHQPGEFTFLHTVATDSRGNLYTGETVGGRRVQKFKLDGTVANNKLEPYTAAGQPGARLFHYDPVAH